MATRKTQSGTRNSDTYGQSGAGGYGHEPTGGTQDGPKPADPWEIEGTPTHPKEDCGCKEPTRPSDPPRPQPTDAKPKGDDCCKQILEILRCIPGIDEKCLHVRKPKTPPKVKITNLCGVLPIKERMVPILLLVLRRLRDGVSPGNTFEQNLQKFLTALPPKRRAALDVALDGYDALPAARRECVFETRFDDWPDEKALDTDFIARNVAAEFIALGRYTRFGEGAAPFPLPSGPRAWEQTFPLPGEPGKFGKIKAPWPWICAISPTGHKAIDETGWFRNESSCEPGNVPRGTINYRAHEFAWSCAPPSPGAPLHCTHVEPSATGGGGGFGGFGTCSGGEDYRAFEKTIGRPACLTVPEVDPGMEIGLRGLNFLSRNAAVHIRKVDNPPFRSIPPQPLTDWQPDTTTPPGVITCEVEDFVYFNMPAEVKDGLNKVPLPPGRYGIQLVVRNDAGYTIAVGEPAPAEFASNEILVNLQPSPDQRFQILIDEAGCDEETDGIGSDEPWFRAIVGSLELPKADTDIQFPVENRIEIMTADGVDSGESISFAPASLFNDKLGRKIIAVGVLGLEVDSEKAAREQIDEYWDAFGDYFNEALVQIGLATSLGGGTLTAVVLAVAKVGAVSLALWVGGAIGAAIAAGAFLYAAWAPADPLALDNMTYTSRELFDMTDVNPAHIPEPSWYRLKQLRMASQSLGKVPAVGGSAIYSEQRNYHSTWENSRYRLTYRFKRI